MNPITCGMAADLLPLYLDGCCSADSRAALEAHMDTCPACRSLCCFHWCSGTLPF